MAFASIAAYGRRHPQAKRPVSIPQRKIGSADMYGPWTAEELLGRALAGRRHGVVASKFDGLVIDDRGSFVVEAGRPRPNGRHRGVSGARCPGIAR
jgi:hypothetical protein